MAQGQTLSSKCSTTITLRNTRCKDSGPDCGVLMNHHQGFKRASRIPWSLTCPFLSSAKGDQATSGSECCWRRSQAFLSSDVSRRFRAQPSSQNQPPLFMIALMTIYLLFIIYLFADECIYLEGQGVLEDPVLGAVLRQTCFL